MPHTRSAKKRLRLSLKRRQHNRSVIKAIKLELKKIDAAANSGNLEALKASRASVVKQLDKAAAKRIVHPNMAARKKSQLARLLNAKTAGQKS
jgi:small subunit ribosomal protein S20